MVFTEGSSSFQAYTNNTFWPTFGNSRQTFGRQQTALSRLAAPPRKRHIVGYAIGLFMTSSGFIAPILMATDPSLRQMGLGIFLMMTLSLISPPILLAWRLIVNLKYNSTRWPRDRWLWESSFLCKRCGNIFQPNKEFAPQVFSNQ